MATRIAVVHDDRWFRAMLAASLREQGHVVTVFDDQEMVDAIWPLSEDTNVRIIEVQGKVPGVRLVVTSIPEAYRMAGGSAFLPGPVTPLDIASAVRRLLPDTGWTMG